MAAQAPSTDSIPSVTFTWKDDASAGPIPAYVYYPKDTQKQGPHPIALVFHAGGFVLGAANLVPKNQIANLVERGFIVVTPEYRLCPQVSLYDGPIQDAKDALKWCQAELPALLKAETSIEADASRIVAMGHSAGGLLALTTGLSAQPPLAIVDFYGCKYLADASWRVPLPMFAALPDPQTNFLADERDKPTVFESVPLFVDGGPNLGDPRCAWYLDQMKKGTAISCLVPDGDYERVDAPAQFKEGLRFPPTYFLHGVPDAFVDYKLTVRAHEELKKLAIETELVVGEEIDHGFDLRLQGTADPLFAKYVLPALDFVERHV